MGGVVYLPFHGQATATGNWEQPCCSCCYFGMVGCCCRSLTHAIHTLLAAHAGEETLPTHTHSPVTHTSPVSHPVPKE
jgi:hypothetical protein